MSLLNFFISKKKKNTANIARKRLQIIVAESRKNNIEPGYLPQLKHEIIQVIQKYVKINSNMITVQLDKKDKDICILELNIILPE
ncbi:cell division topological specificity factor MinE [Buchnera aphidicola (Thelaxes californica)]|uniref:Cell division topological specificity factor n=1 Tax=Buchnera aphidicola (Thelaxes californica) TaxID=1315998 RepID=A0A4D6YLD5_9GAMM|nr:cell division topological specificity factor MinE [Buchnera aphidicola]QCI26784.1 cell division topological specificity factor MinE [Buchnera aphidicola (Thelaxes californica)]